MTSDSLYLGIVGSIQIQISPTLLHLCQAPFAQAFRLSKLGHHNPPCAPLLLPIFDFHLMHHLSGVVGYL